MGRLVCLIVIAMMLFSLVTGSILDSTFSFQSSGIVDSSFNVENTLISTFAPSVAVSGIFTGNPSVYGNIIAFSSDFDNRYYLMYYDISTGALRNTTIPWAWFPSIYQNKIVYIVFIRDTIELYDISTGRVTTIQYPRHFTFRDFASWVGGGMSVLSLYGNIIAYYDSEGVWYYDMTTSIWTKIIGDPSFFISYGVSAYGDNIVFSPEISPTIRYYNIVTKTTIDTGINGMNPSIFGNIIAFHQGNSIKYYSISSGSLINTGVAGVGAAIYGDVIAFSTNETWVSTDLNGDGDLVDFVVRSYSISSGSVTNTGETGGVSVSPTGIVLAKPSIYGEKFVFITEEVDLGVDVDNDGDLDDWVVRFIPPLLNNLTIIQIVPIQVIWENKVPAGEARALIKDKKTVMYVKVISTFAARVWIEILVEYDFLTKMFIDFGPGGNGVPIDPGINEIYIPGGPRQNPWWAPWGVRPGQPNWLEWTMVGLDNNIRVIVDWFNRVPEANENDNDLFTSKKFVQSNSLSILVVPVFFPTWGEGPFVPALGGADDFILGTYPVADNQFTWMQIPALAWPPRWLRLRPALNWEDWLYLNVANPIATLALLAGYNRVVIVVQNLGWFVRASGIAIGMLRNPENPIPVVVENGVDIETVVHEIGHTFHLWHPHDLGPARFDSQRFWVAQRDYENWMDTFMSYRNPPLWIDKGRFDSDPLVWLPPGWYWIPGDPVIGIAPQWIFLPVWTLRWNLYEQLVINIDPEVIRIQGFIFKNGTVLVDKPWYRLPEGTPDLTFGTSGNYSIVLLNSQGQIINQMGFNASFTYLLDLDGILTQYETDQIEFNFNIPYVIGTATVEIRNATTGIVLASRTISTNSPTVEVAYPNGGEALAAGINYTISWNGYDLDGDNLTYTLAYSADGGENWIPLAIDLNQASYVWDTRYLQKGSNYLVKVIATDGINTGEDISDGNFTVIKKLGDLNFDGVVNYKDASIFRQAYIGAYNYLADFNQDGVINYKDASLFRGYYIAG